MQHSLLLPSHRWQGKDSSCQWLQEGEHSPKVMEFHLHPKCEMVNLKSRNPLIWTRRS